MRYRLAILCTLGLTLWHGPCPAQTYPSWFLRPLGTDCLSVAGYADASALPDSAAARAIRNAKENYARRRLIGVDGKQVFWDTEAGMVWMGSTFSQSFDSTYLSVAERGLFPLDTMGTQNMVIVLLGSKTCGQVDKRRLSLARLSPPKWRQDLPACKKYYFALGMAPNYP